MAFVHVEHRTQQRAVVDHEVVGQQHGERLVADMMACDRHRVTETEWIALTHVVDVGEIRGELHLLQLVVLSAVLEEVLELEVAVEVILDRALVATRDDQDVGEPGSHGLFHDVLDRGLVDDGQHLLGRALRGR